jgi:hypothetical protein
LGAVVGVAEDWSEDSEGGGVVEDCAKGDGGWLDWWEVWQAKRSAMCISNGTKRFKHLN